MNKKKRLTMTNSREKTILITGCSKGIGFCTANTLKALGYRVFATARKKSDVIRLQELGFQSEVLDLVDTSSIDSAVANILDKTDGQLDAVVNNAGYLVLGAVEDTPIEIFKEQFETNFFGAVYLTNKVISVMRKQGRGRIVFISSVNGFIATPYTGAYSASKFALEGLVEALAMELTDSLIQVSIIEPGFIETDLRNVHLPVKQGSIHQLNYDQLTKINNQSDGKKTLPFIKPSEAVVKKIIHALESSSPKFRYRITLFTQIMFLLKYLLPDRILIKLLSNITKKKLTQQKS